MSGWGSGVQIPTGRLDFVMRFRSLMMNLNISDIVPAYRRKPS